MEKHTDAQILRKIAILQTEQKSYPPSSPHWIAVSAQLLPLFREMAKRYPDPIAA